MRAKNKLALRGIWLGILLVDAQVSFAEPVTVEIQAVLEGAANGWTDAIIADSAPMDEQIFTEISPLIESPDSVRLPEDQKLAD
ncbi:MAG: hypothetical protein GKR90_21890 [Pseudomonadales bacterium]|nr:hypothetical protein [Pseudomonadales bacterium]